MASLEDAAGFKIRSFSKGNIPPTAAGDLSKAARRRPGEMDRLHDVVRGLRGGKAKEARCASMRSFPARASSRSMHARWKTRSPPELSPTRHTLGAVGARVLRREADGHRGPLAASKAVERVAVGSIPCSRPRVLACRSPRCRPHPHGATPPRAADRLSRGATATRPIRAVLPIGPGGGRPVTKRELIAGGLAGNLPALLGELTRLEVEA